MKKTSSRIIILVLLCLVGLSVYLYLSKSKLTSVEGDSRNFNYKDTAAITKIFIADKDNNRSTLVRTPKGWVVNDKYNCRNDAVLNLLEAVKLLEVKMPVPKPTRDNVIKFMSFNAVKVEIYVGDEKVRQYYVGHESPDAEGSYMLLSDPESGKNFKEPYICFIPGFNGFLAPRFIASENDWRDRIVVNFIPPQIKEIKVEHVGLPKDSSFVIELPNANTFLLKDLNGKKVEYEIEKMRQYLVYYQNVSYEALVTGKNKTLEDSLSKLLPFTVITVTERDQKQNVYKMYRKQFTGARMEDHGVRFEFDPDRFYLRFGNGNSWALSQYFVFGKLLVNPSYFVPSNSAPKPH